MAVNYTEEQLNNVDKSFLIQLLLQQQEQLNALTKELHASNEKMQLLMEQVILGKQNRFGRSSGKNGRYQSDLFSRSKRNDCLFQ